MYVRKLDQQHSQLVTFISVKIGSIFNSSWPAHIPDMFLNPSKNTRCSRIDSWMLVAGAFQSPRHHSDQSFAAAEPVGRRQWACAGAKHGCIFRLLFAGNEKGRTYLQVMLLGAVI